jgi:hypothetical protein
MNKFARMLMQDGRNPYGSRGGYVRSDRRSDYEDDYAMRGNRDRNDMARSNRGYDRDMEDYRRSGYTRRDRNEDYASYNDRRMHDYDDEEDYRRRDYGKPEMFSHKDMETWKSMMKNEDGTRGEHFRPDQVKHACQQAGIDCEEFGEDIFCLAMNMMYSDYCKVAKKYGVDRPEYYADLAKAFLRDKDFDGKPEEKLYLYYKAIVEQDD